MVGVSIEKHFFASVHDSITKYMPELQGKGLESIEIQHLLDMRSGLKFNESYNSPFSDMAKYYYGKNLKKYIQSLELEETPGTNYNYQSVNTLLLGLALENATGKKLTELLQQEIWTQIGMEYDASWNIDSKKHQTVKAFCCVNARPIDFARFGRLYLNQGNWDGKQIIPQKWVKESLKIHNDSRDSQNYPYSYHWRVLPSGAFFAKGVLGQYIYVDPNKKLIIIRMGKSIDKINWPLFFELFSEHL